MRCREVFVSPAIVTSEMAYEDRNVERHFSVDEDTVQSSKTPLGNRPYMQIDQEYAAPTRAVQERC